MSLNPGSTAFSVLAVENKGGHIVRRLQEEIQKQATDSDHDVTAITLALTAGFQHTKATMALQVGPFEPNSS